MQNKPSRLKVEEKYANTLEYCSDEKTQNPKLNNPNLLWGLM